MDATSPTPTVVARGANNNSDSDLGTSTTTGTGTGSGGRKHAKGLSLNLPLPILVPPQLQMSASVSQSPSQSLSQSQSPSPRTRWSYQGPILLDSPARSSHASASPIRVSTSSSSFAADERSIGTGSGSDSSWMRRNKTSGAGARTRTSADFLTLLAAQERRVLELREELQKAEADLLGLKKQWASYEANKKREEVKHVKKLEALPLDDVVSSRSPTSTSGGGGAFDDDEEERRRRRALVERSVRMNGNTAATGVNDNYTNDDGEEYNDNNNGHVNGAGAATEQLGRRTSTKKPRVFQGGRHTRTLSLLSPTSAKYRQQQQGQEDGTGTMSAKSSDAMIGDPGVPTDGTVRADTDGRRVSDDSSSRSSLSLTRMTMTTTLDGLISGADSLQQLGFGKTYKELATAHRRSLPPVAADLLVKQGKQVYEGVREGLWTFWEDIRQATVGEEGINGPATNKPQQQQQPGQKRSMRRENGNVETGQKKRGSSTSNSTATATSATRTQRNRNHGPERSRDRDGQSAPESKSKEPVSSFWREFGLDTPHKQQVQSRLKRPDQTPTQGQTQGYPRKSDRTTTQRHAQQKSVTSTDSSTPPSLIPDLNDDDNETGINRDDEDDTPWDAWDSPVSTRVTDAVAPVLTGRSADSDTLIATTDPGNGGNNSLAAAASPSSTGQLLPWPEIAKPEKLATSDQQGLKLTRTVSDLMKEWDG
ncbi:hypothetical protein HRR83_005804 [Exophiala dermatitidis]|uniref:DUF4048 domain-containing protein n=2 Tax=Exophiala dermatitidis TaxID=5970 RepID=H6BUW7_EXODN|nr:uncharacterized protein HMPREF1120_03096 [Exophiala dermatitidis NIH/UT8656]KAJ4508712.1 hypothetical protein HRR73_007379 [Exophiala dermatitidis]EHY54937.1 hypothetical protein HMPREF1120_03096 [Exophiala dermatitidis NIH/UT8656]KAJ4510959.1 hypothetical protein HRR75_005653 [Exophiala dermatitidis]KAJ4513361.1 hypothetical protein HRR74_006173 [Exophiala dermatitidis]KAJ4538088.1 hypothetical protein HRR77_007128 [Exophiala dermatitidis]